MTRIKKLEIILLDLVYPAILGSLLFMFFVRLATQGTSAFQDAGTWLGLIAAVFFSLGFLNAKVDTNYQKSDAALDTLSSLLVFVNFFLLKFAETDPLKTSDTKINFWLVYLAFLFSTLLPFFRRWLGDSFRWDDYRNYLLLLALVALFSGILIDSGVSSWFNGFSPWTIVIVLGVLCLIYAWALFAKDDT